MSGYFLSPGVNALVVKKAAELGHIEQELDVASEGTLRFFKEWIESIIGVQWSVYSTFPHDPAALLKGQHFERDLNALRGRLSSPGLFLRQSASDHVSIIALDKSQSVKVGIHAVGYGSNRLYWHYPRIDFPAGTGIEISNGSVVDDQTNPASLVGGLHSVEMNLPCLPYSPPGAPTDRLEFEIQFRQRVDAYHGTNYIDSASMVQSNNSASNVQLICCTEEEVRYLYQNPDRLPLWKEMVVQGFGHLVQ